jgi:hypothetical protein
MIRAGLDVTIDAPGMPRRWAHVERVDAIDALSVGHRLANRSVSP